MPLQVGDRVLPMGSNVVGKVVVFADGGKVVWCARQPDGLEAPFLVGELLQLPLPREEKNHG